MTIALKLGGKDDAVNALIIFDAVTAYSRTLSGRATAHPIDSGADISDHFISSNPRFSISGVISDVDITGMSDIRIDGETPMNGRAAPHTATVYGSETVMRYLPSAVRQYYERNQAEVIVDPDFGSVRDGIEELFNQIMGGLFFNNADNRWRNKMTECTIYEMEGRDIRKAHKNIILTDVQWDETPDSGDGLSISIQCERVRWVTLDKTDMPVKATSKSKGKVAASKGKGKPSTTKGDETSTSSDAPASVRKGSLADTFNDAVRDASSQ